MGQVNVNPPPSGAPVGEPAGSSGAGFILGIIIAIILIAVLVWLFVLAPAPSTTDGGGDTTDGGEVEPPAPSAWVLTDRA
jgi:hypothetical protein